MPDFQEAFSQIDQYVEQRMRVDKTPGAAIAITDREKLLWISTYGFADIAAKKLVTPETLFEIGSIGKSFTAIVVLQLYEAGLLDLHTPVSEYLPWFQVQSKYGPITTHHLLSHTAGLIRGTDFSPAALYEVWALRETETGHMPGEHFHYSNVGYKVLGLMLEHLLSQPYGEIIQSRILEPLGMTATAPIITHETRHRLAVGYQFHYDDRPPHVDDPLVPATWLETDTGDGSIASTAADMAGYLRMFMNQGEGPQGRLLSQASFELMRRPVIKVEEENYYGYGLGLKEVEGHPHLGHGRES